MFQAQLGFTGIAVALLGRNRAGGIAIGAVLFAFLNEQSTQLEFAQVDVSKTKVRWVSHMVARRIRSVPPAAR